MEITAKSTPQDYDSYATRNTEAQKYSSSHKW